MKTGPLPFAKRKLSPDLRVAACEAMRDKRPSGQTLAVVAGYRAQTQLSAALHSRRVTASPLTVSRLQRVAEIIGYSGALFLEEEPS